LSGIVSNPRIGTHRHITLHIIFTMTILPILDLDGFNAFEYLAELVSLDWLLDTVDLVSLQESCPGFVDVTGYYRY